MTYVNADIIAQGLSGFNPESAAIEAGRILLGRVHAPADQRASFAFESTLAGRSQGRLLRSWRQSGYLVHVVYFWLASADLAVARVAERVRLGGHRIPAVTIRQRYQRSIDNFFDLYRPIASSWEVYDNTQASPAQLVAHGDCTGVEVVLNSVVWDETQKARSNG
jgi:predicted ABC-type ATPase